MENVEENSMEGLIDFENCVAEQSKVSFARKNETFILWRLSLFRFELLWKRKHEVILY